MGGGDEARGVAAKALDRRRVTRPLGEDAHDDRPVDVGLTALVLDGVGTSVGRRDRAVERDARDGLTPAAHGRARSSRIASTRRRADGRSAALRPM
jgi:hypothetical protein